MLNPLRWAFFQTKPVGDLQGKPFSDFNQRFQIAVQKNNLQDALRIANHAAADHGAAGFLLRHQVNSLLRDKDIDNGDVNAQDGLNMLAELMLAEKLCQQHPENNAAVDQLYPNRANNFWPELIRKFAEEANETLRMDEAEYTVKTMISFFQPVVDPKVLERREALLDTILPSRTQTLSKAKRDLVLTNVKSQQDDPNLKAEKIHIHHPTGYVEAVVIQPSAHPQRVIIHCRGNGEFYQEFQGDFLAEAKRNNAVVVGFNYPSVGDSSKCELTTSVFVNAIKAVVEDIHKKTQIDYNDITLKGHSLGAALASLAAEELHDEDHPVRLTNGRSFSSLEKAAKLPSGFMGKKAELLSENPDLMIEPGYAFLRIPESHRLLICGANDPIVQQPCSMLDYVCEQKPEQAAQIREASLFKSQLGGGFIHNSDLKFLTNAKNQTASDVFDAFVQKPLAKKGLEIQPEPK